LETGRVMRIFLGSIDLPNPLGVLASVIFPRTKTLKASSEMESEPERCALAEAVSAEETA
jgi:hypothetical protein